jgi:hypothetical protein
MLLYRISGKSQPPFFIFFDFFEIFPKNGLYCLCSSKKGGDYSMNTSFYYGMGLGMIAGAAFDRMTHPKKKKGKLAGKAMKVIGSLVEDAAEMMR